MLQSQILESMVTKSAPDRQELTEITSATLDGADTFIMCSETSKGQHVQDAVVQLTKGIAEAESIFDYEQAYVNIRETIKAEGINAKNIDVLASTSCQIAFAKDSDVDMLICVTETGKIARALAK